LTLLDRTTTAGQTVLKSRYCLNSYFTQFIVKTHIQSTTIVNVYRNRNSKIATTPKIKMS